MAKQYLDYPGLKRFRDYIKDEVKTMIGLGESEDELSYAQNTDIDTGVVADEESGNGVITLKNLAYYHKKLASEVRTSSTDLNSAVLDTVADALTLKTDGSEIEKSEIYENVEAIIDDKMTWNNEFPE